MSPGLHLTGELMCACHKVIIGMGHLMWASTRCPHQSSSSSQAEGQDVENRKQNPKLLCFCET